MIIDIQLSDESSKVEVLEPQDCRHFHVAVRGGTHTDLAAALRATEVGQLLPSGEAVIDTAAVVRMCSGKVTPGWADDFAAMLDYADSKGWFDQTNHTIRAHVEWAG